MQELRNFISQIHPVTDKDWDLFSSRLEEVTFEKGTMLLRTGVIEKHLSFIVSGMVRLYVPQPENDLTFGFLFSNEFVTAYDSFLTQSPSYYHVETLAKTTLWRISHSDLEYVYQNTEYGNLIGRKIAENKFLQKAKRERALLGKTAEERYLDLFNERPRLLQEIPLKYIASYIGVTPQALSRIRKRITHT